MTGITFYLQILFALLLFWATATAHLHGHIPRPRLPQPRTQARVPCRLFAAVLAVCFLMYSWSYLSW